jgi:hypothetical protein
MAQIARPVIRGDTGSGRYRASKQHHDGWGNAKESAAIHICSGMCVDPQTKTPPARVAFLLRLCSGHEANFSGVPQG